MKLPTGKYFYIRMQATEMHSMLDDLQHNPKNKNCKKKVCICSKIKINLFVTS